MTIDREDKHRSSRAINQLHEVPLTLDKGLCVRRAYELLSAWITEWIRSAAEVFINPCCARPASAAATRIEI